MKRQYKLTSVREFSFEAKDVEIEVISAVLSLAKALRMLIVFASSLYPHFFFIASYLCLDYVFGFLKYFCYFTHDSVSRMQ